MLWELAHRPRDVDQATRVELEAPSSGVAIEQLRSKMPAEEVILFVRRID